MMTSFDSTSSMTTGLSENEGKSARVISDDTTTPIIDVQPLSGNNNNIGLSIPLPFPSNGQTTTTSNLKNGDNGVGTRN